NLQASLLATNSGSLTLTNGSASITTGPFSIISSTAFSIPGFGSTNVIIRFTPASEGNFTNVVTIATATSGNSTNTVTGTGAVVPVSSFVGSPTSGLKPLTVNFTDNSTGTITNRFW